MSDSDNPDKRQWLRDEVSPALVQLHSIKREIFRGKTSFQAVSIIDTDSFGLCLVLDDKIQSSYSDEFIYHEALVHPVMLAHKSPETVFIAGGGEGATLREVLRHTTVKKVVMVDIDKEVIDICHKYLPDVHRGSFEDPRCELVIMDARKYLEETKDSFDVAIVDLVEPLEAGPACMLYTSEFYQMIRSILKPGGIVGVQSGAAGWTNLQNFTAIHNTIKSVFPVARPYQVYVPSFVDMWGFTAASETIDAAVITPEKIDRSISARIDKELLSYDGQSHITMFSLPKHLRTELEKETRIITDNQPLYM